MAAPLARVASDPRGFAFALVACSTVVGMAGTDLVLPAVPTLASLLGGDLERAQLVLAAFVAGAACGLLGFGALGSRLDQRSVLGASLLGYGLVSACAGASGSLNALIALRFLQGAAGSAAAVFAPGLLRAIYGDSRAVGALGKLGSLEALTPALAPIAGTWLLHAWGWGASFHTVALSAAVLGVAVLLGRHRLPAIIGQRRHGSYGALCMDSRFLRYALSQAFTLGGLLVFVFGSPTVFVATLGATLNDFIILQVTGIASYIAAASLTGRLSSRHGAERLIGVGTAVSAAGAAGLLVYALLGGADTRIVTALFVPLNVGLGLRGPPGFHRAVIAARGDDARGAALVLVAVLISTAGGTAIVAPFIRHGLVALALASFTLVATALGLLLALPAGAPDPAPSRALDAS